MLVVALHFAFVAALEWLAAAPGAAVLVALALLTDALDFVDANHPIVLAVDL